MSGARLNGHAHAARRQQFEGLLFEHLPVMHAVARRLTRSATDAEDLVQETCLRAYRFFDGFEPGTNFRAWLLRILKNGFINAWHQRQSSPRVESLDLSEEAWQHHVASVAYSPFTSDPESELGRTLLREDIDEALASLPVEFRMVVILCLLEGFSYQETAEVLEIKIGTVMSRLHRGRKALQARLLSAARARGFAPPPTEA